MKILRTLILAGLIATPVAAASNPEDAVVQRFAMGLIKTLAGVVNGGSAVWDKLGQGQATSTLQQLATKAANLQISNNRLKADLSNGRIHTGTELGNRVDALKDSLQDIDNLLDKFADEIDAAAHPIGEQLRIELGNAMIDKNIELSDIGSTGFGKDSATDNIKHLNVAIADLDEMRAALTCLQDTITTKKAACDPKTLKPTP
jgi:hypothetical protein